MAKNRPRKQLGHLVDFFVFHTNKIFLSIIWLEIWWDVVKHPNTIFRQLWWISWVQTVRKVAWTSKTPQILEYCLVWSSTRKMFNFFYHHCKGKAFTDIFCVESLFPTCLVWALWLYEWKQLVFLAYVKNGFSPKTTSQRRQRWARPISKVTLLSYGSADVFKNSLAQHGSTTSEE